MSYSIAIDGPAGAGKSTIAKKLADRLSFTYIDTGAMYRAMAVHFINQGIESADEERISDALKSAEITLGHEDGEQKIFLNGDNITARLRDERVGEMASAISVYPVVRRQMVALQQQLAVQKNVIMEGRDIGTVVLPDATLKVYLTAGTGERALRRHQQLAEKNIACDLNDIRQELETRDYRDMHRSASPLQQAEDAVLIDSSKLDAEEVVDKISSLYHERIRV